MKRMREIELSESRALGWPTPNSREGKEEDQSWNLLARVLSNPFWHYICHGLNIQFLRIQSFQQNILLTKILILTINQRVRTFVK